MPGLPINPAVLAELQRQLNHELAAAHAYTALAVWCVDQNLKGFAQYFYKQSVEERAHAQRFIDHLLDRGQLPELRDLPAPRGRFDALLDVARQAQQMERDNTAGVNAVYEVALREKDYPAQVMLHWFINEQVEEEDWTDEMVERVESAGCAGALSDLDRHIDRYLSHDPKPECAGE
jgi:ferritin